MQLTVSSLTVSSLGKFCLSAFLTGSLAINSALADTTPKHGLAIHGEPELPADYTQLRYVNPNAPKGGELRLAEVNAGGFDSLNPYIVKGVSAPGLGYVYETLAEQPADEASVEYGRIAEKLETPADRSWVTFHLNPKARFSDDQPITSADVKFSFETITSKGHPLYASYYAGVKEVEILDDQRIKFHFKDANNNELPIILGQLPVLAKHYWQGRDFSKSSLDIPVGSGPYTISKVDPGRAITYQRNPNYWGKAIPLNVGRYNFDTITIEIYRDNNIALEAFKSGNYDFRQESTSKTWHTGYTGPQFDKGETLKQEVPHQNPTGMQGFVFNLRKDIFKDPKVREALGYAFDFEWSNKNLFYGAYTRTQSYFSNSELASSGLPSPAELEILEKYRGQIPDRVFTTPYLAPATKGNGDIRGNLRKAQRLLKAAGWQVKNKQLTHLATGNVMSFEILLASEGFKRIVLPFKKNLARLGVDVEVRLVDIQQYVNRVNNFDFDMVVLTMGQSHSPGNEQRDFWNSKEADRPGSRNRIGIKDPVIDELIELIINAPDRESLVIRTRALDRVLLANHFVIPQWHHRAFRIAYWDKFGRPAQPPAYSIDIDSWWSKEGAKNAEK